MGVVQQQEGVYIYTRSSDRAHSEVHHHRRHINMTLLDLIPEVISKDPTLAQIILDLYLYYNSMKILLTHQHELHQLQHQEAQRRAKRKRRTVWVRPYLRRRLAHGHSHNLRIELAGESKDLYKNFLRIDEELFKEIAQRIRPFIEKQDTRLREAIDVETRLAITLRFLATGNTYRTISYAFRVAPNTISKIVPETCRAIIAVYGDEVMKLPNTPEEWKTVAKGFEERWNFPHAIGAIDGKHVRIRNPIRAGSTYYNYKKFFSMVLLALVDYKYNFTFIDVGAVGAESDAGVFAHSRLYQLFNNTTANLPPAEPLPDDANGPDINYFMIGDDAFALKGWLLKGYPNRGLTQKERVFNYRLSRARRVVENAFGILANR